MRIIRKIWNAATGTPTCKCGCGHVAESREDSVLQLSAACADRLFPGADTVRYRALVERYGY